MYRQLSYCSIDIERTNQRSLVSLDIHFNPVRFPFRKYEGGVKIWSYYRLLYIDLAFNC